LSGIKYLKSISQFDEIIVGPSTFNLGSVYYFSGLQSTPEMFIILESHETGLNGINIHNLKERQKILNTLSGIYEINEFYSVVNEGDFSKIMKTIGLE